MEDCNDDDDGGGGGGRYYSHVVHVVWDSFYRGRFR